MACSIVVLSLSGWNSGNDRDVLVHDVLVSGADENTEFRGLSE
jgi:hypothetical protein